MGLGADIGGVEDAEVDQQGPDLNRGVVLAHVTVSLVTGDGQQRLVGMRPDISGNGFFEVVPVNDDLPPGSKVVIGK